MRPSSVPAQLKRLVVASANPGKLTELRDLLADAPFDLTSLGELGLSSPEETGTSFLENAVLKARHAAAASGSAAIADDSGLEVDALGGAPGVYSARFAGAHADDAANNAKLIAALRALDPHRHPQPWPARYRCVLVLLRDADDPAPLTAEGIWEGAIIAAPRGGGGFGYDPHFWLPELSATAAQLDPALKNRLSHRGAALRKLRALL
jgi:XTP/dITP diphosphohydrolase